MSEVSPADLAVADARRSAAAAGVEIRLLKELAGQNLARELFDQVWSSDGETQVTSNLMQALVHNGSYVSGAFIGSRFVAAASDGSGCTAGAGPGLQNQRAAWKHAAGGFDSHALPPSPPANLP